MESPQTDVQVDGADWQSTFEESTAFYDDYVPIFGTALDRHGHRSIQLHNTKTGVNTTYSDLFSGTMAEDPAMRAWFSRLDKYFCWALHDHVRPQFLRTTLQYLSTPVFITLMGYSALRFRWDVWMGR